MCRRHLFGRQFDAEVAARHHHRVGELEDFGEAVERLRLFDFRQQRCLAADQRARFGDIFGALDKAQGNPVDTLFKRECQVGAVLGGQRRQRHHDIGDVDALVVRQEAADFDARFDARRIDMMDAQHDLAVIEQQPRARGERREQFAVRQLDPRHVAGRRVMVEGEGLAV